MFSGVTLRSFTFVPSKKMPDRMAAMTTDDDDELKTNIPEATEFIEITLDFDDAAICGLVLSLG